MRARRWHGISCDQADWVEAKVKLQDGREIWLADLPLQEGLGRPPFTTEPQLSFPYDGQPLAVSFWSGGWPWQSPSNRAPRS